MVAGPNLSDQCRHTIVSRSFTGYGKLRRLSGPREWAEFMLVVRNVSGSVDQWLYEWELNHKYNQKFGKKFKERQIGNDIIRGPPASPIPPIAYFIIKRTE
ncbi:hypothetical protein ANCCAN_03516 [Ancylostoma caninum]|uniref:Uncharacterized protein n=1 Tax=Ancylostoma caninum TaxID=29170 RepID=A0A368H118_ANCCA|nr:hypothetical protein ANCCAN_03516 [Ancylostoma caninum]